MKPVRYTWRERQKWFQSVREKIQARDFPDGSVVQNPPSSAGNSGLTPGWGTKVPPATEQLSLHDLATEFKCYNERS